jgi:hypothetical protein
LFIIDIGFNTVDYVVAVGEEKKKGNTIEKQGVERMIELFGINCLMNYLI